MKHSFKNDYSEMVHPKILESFAAIGNSQFEGYGLDEFSDDAALLIRAKINKPDADIHFISGGTHANLVVISSALRPHEAVIAVKSGHIFVHETGAIEATGHKICTCEGSGGKLCVSDIKSVLDEHAGDEHMVKPRLVYVSLSTECGTVYTKDELSAISEFCHANDLYLYIDGARLGAALNSFACDLEYSDIADFADAFFIGGTKNGALFGEAIVICNNTLKNDFRFLLKQRGGLMAKTAAIGVQFKTLFTDNLYDELALYANNCAQKLAEGIKKLGYSFLYPAQTNLIIPVFPAAVAEKLHVSHGFYDWQSIESNIAARLLTSWATPGDKIDEFLADLAKL
ncbi:MAG: aminotransferase class V-fold PLP-dependent enzyme [Oscillospiraceae bacterium]|nr:aminotransferase class V-fold PLP-dependent enzyme [Oscillospiraceae bacterium]